MAADLTSTANIIIDADDKGIILGENQDTTIFADAAGKIKIARGATTTIGTNEGQIILEVRDSNDCDITVNGGEGGDAGLYLNADQEDDNDDKYVLLSTAAGNLEFKSYSTGSWVTQLKLDGSATDVTVSTGNLVIPTADKGISFTGGTDPDTAGTATANILDDYEEGTFTAVFTVGSGSITADSGSDLCAYTKIGRLVHVQGLIGVSAVSSPSGDIAIAMPFTAGNFTETAGAGGGAMLVDRVATAVDGYVGLYNDENSTAMYIREGGTTGVGSDLAAHIDTDTFFVLSHSFMTA